MGQGRRCQSACRRILLIAVAIQGISPDAQDLVSTKAICVVCPVLAGDLPICDEDDSPDEVCELLRLDRVGQSYRKADETTFRIIPEVEFLRPTLAEGPSGRACHGGIDERSTRLIHSLCRLVC